MIINYTDRLNELAIGVCALVFFNSARSHGIRAPARFEKNKRTRDLKYFNHYDRITILAHLHQISLCFIFY